MSKSNTNAMFLDDLFSAASLHGEATNIVISVLRSGRIDWSNKERVKEIAREFVLGRIAGSLDLDRISAVAVLEKKDINSKVQDDNVRSMREHQAWRAAVSAWSNISLQAGKPKGAQGTRKPRTPAPVATPNAAERLAPVEAALSIKAPSSTEDVAAFALRVCDMLVAYENRIGTVKAGEYREHMDTFIANVRALAASEKVAEPATV